MSVANGRPFRAPKMSGAPHARRRVRPSRQLPRAAWGSEARRAETSARRASARAETRAETSACREAPGRRGVCCRARVGGPAGSGAAPIVSPDS